jgi:hypothetical protein
VPLGPNQQYSPLYYHSYNGFWFFNNIFYSGDRLIDTSGLLFSGGGNNYELSVYFQNEVGITCHGGPPAVCREVKDGHGYAFWIYQKSTDTLHQKSFGNLLLTPRRTCSIKHPLKLKDQSEAEGESIHLEKPVEEEEETPASSVATWVITAAALLLGTGAYWYLKPPAQTYGNHVVSSKPIK